jgi:hypothetical protein
MEPNAAPSVTCGVPICHPYLEGLTPYASWASVRALHLNGGPALITYLSLFCSALSAALSSRQHLVLEYLALRQQLAVLSRQSRRPRLDPSDRLFWSFLSQLWSRWQSAAALVSRSRLRPTNRTETPRRASEANTRPRCSPWHQPRQSVPSSSLPPFSG